MSTKVTSAPATTTIIYAEAPADNSRVFAGCCLPSYLSEPSGHPQIAVQGARVEGEESDKERGLEVVIK